MSRLSGKRNYATMVCPYINNAMNNAKKMLKNTLETKNKNFKIS